MNITAWTYVRDYLVAHGADTSDRAEHPFRVRSAHIRRVCLWLERLLAQGGVEDVEALRLAAAFHDVGYVYSKEVHGLHSARVLEAYAAANGVDAAIAARAVFLVREHSNKERWLSDPDAPMDLILLMEADLLDEEGAMGLVFDCLSAAASGEGTYEGVWARMRRFEPERVETNRMVTPLGRSLWAEKQRILREFLAAYANDLGIDDAEA